MSGEASNLEDLALPALPGLWRTVIRRGRADWAVMVASWLLLVSALSLVTAGSLYSGSLALAGLHRALGASAPSDRAIVVTTRILPDRLAAADAVVDPELRLVIAPVGGELVRVLRSGPFAAASTDASAVKDLLVFASYQGIERHAALVAGRWAVAGADPLEATLSEPAAAALGVHVGDTLDLADRLTAGRLVTVVVSGTWRLDPADPWWLDETLARAGQEAGVTYTTRGPLVVAPEDLAGGRLSNALDVEWRALPDIAGFGSDTLDAVRADVAGLPARINAALPGSNQATVATKLPAILEETGRSVLVMQAGVLLLLVQFGVVAAYAIVLVAALLVERRRPETALLRARGAGPGRLLALALGEALLLVVPAVAVAPWLAVPLVALVQRNPALAPVGMATPLPGPSTFVLAALAGVVSLLALTLPTLVSAMGRESRIAAERPPERTLPQRLGLDLALVAFAAVGLLQLRLYGAPLTQNARGVLGIDPLLVAAPAIGLVGGAVLAIRFVPRAAELAERLAVRGRGLTFAIAGRTLARRPLRSTRVALLLLLAAGLGTYASAHAATWTRSQTDQAEYAAAADLRLTTGPRTSIPGWAMPGELRAIPGVTAASPVTRASAGFGPALRDVPVLGVDGSSMAAVVRLRDDGTAGHTLAGLAAIAAMRRAEAGVLLPDGSQQLAIVVEGSFATVNVPVSAAMPTTVSADVILADGFGRLVPIAAEGVPLGTGEVRIVMPLTVPGTAGAASGPLRIVAIDLALAFTYPLTDPVPPQVLGSADLLRLETAGTDGAWSSLDPRSLPGAAYLSIGGDRWVPYTPPAGHPGTILVDQVFASDNVNYRLSYAATTPAPIPALVDDAFLAQTGAQVGESLKATIQGTGVTLVLVDRVESFPPLDPRVPFILVDRGALDDARLSAKASLSGDDEWWLAVAPGASGGVALRVTAEPIAAETVVDRAALLAGMTGDPLGLGVIGILGLGSVAALVFAAIGFLVNATVSIADRLGELALLKALGLSPRQLMATLAIEHASLLAVSLLAGTGLGLLLAWLVLPFATLTPAGEPPVPAPVVVVPPDAAWPVLALAVGLVVATLLLARRQLPAARTSAVLRARDE